MKIFRLKRTQSLRLSLSEAWSFFASPYNLKKITPPHLKFDVTYASGDGDMYAGQIISYKLNPVAGIPVKWTTEITHIDRPNFFVDEQRTGPYALWHHQHHFKAIDQGVEMTDEVNYALPLGVLGRMAHQLLVQKKLKTIFDYRFEVLEGLFNNKLDTK